MSIEALLQDCRSQGISLTLGPDDQLDLHAKTTPAAALLSRLKQHKPQLIRYLQELKIVQLEQALAEPVPKLGPWRQTALSFQQERMWLLEQLQAGATEYNLSRSFLLQGSLHQTALAQALAYLADFHPIFRTSYHLHHDLPSQQLAEHSHFQLRQLDLSMAGTDQQQQCRRLLQTEAEHPFMLGVDSCFRALLIRLAADRYIFSITLHHISADGWSVAILCQQITELYRQFRSGQLPQLTPPACDYADFARWQRQRLSTERVAPLVRRWQQRLADAIPNLTFPPDQPRSPQPDRQAAVFQQQFSPEQWQHISTFARRCAVSPFVVLYSAFSLLLARYSGCDDVLTGTTLANRDHPQLQTLVGYVANTVVLRSRIDPQQNFRQLLTQASEVVSSAFSDGHLPFEQLLDHLAVTRQQHQPPLFNVMLVLHNMKPVLPELEHITITPVAEQHRQARYDLALDIWQQADHLQLEWEYATALYQPERIAQIASDFQYLLQQLLKHDQQPLATIPLLDSTAVAQYQRNWQGPQTEIFAQGSVVSQCLSQALRRPQQIAIQAGDIRLSYQELAQQVNNYAAALAALLPKPGQIIGVYCQRHAQLPVILLAIWQSGHAYLPLDPAYPTARLAHMINDSQAALLLTDDDLLGQAALLTSKVLSYRQLLQLPKAACPAINAEALAYVIYTSGSTGLPKGVQLSQAAVANFLQAMASRLQLTATDHLLAVTSISFDIHVLELFLPLLSGARLTLASQDPQQLLHLLQQDVSLMQATPTSWQMLRDFGWQPAADLQVLSGGEALPAELLAFFLQHQVRIWNMYGPTETCVWSAMALLTPDRQIHLGQPIDNTGLYLLDRHQQLVPAGVCGELAITGAGLAIGYLNQPALTAEKFIQLQLPGQQQCRAYLTGDLGRIDAQGKLRYLGRADNQIKLHGHRIETGEIENLLCEMAVVSAAVVLLNPAEQRLYAFVQTAAAESSELPAQLLHYLQQRLPAFMLPAQILLLAAFPQTPNGKTDRKALQQLLGQLPAHAVAVASNHDLSAYPAVLVRLWQEQLGLTQLDPAQSFFALGGNSIRFVTLIAKLKQQTGLDLPIRQLLADPSLKNLAAALHNAGADVRVELTLAADLPQQPNWQHAPITVPSLPNRRSLLQRGGSQHFWVVNQTIVLEDPEQNISFTLICQTIQTLCAHHPALRSRFSADFSTEQIVDLHTLFSAELCVDLSGTDSLATAEQRLRQTLAEMAGSPQLFRLFYLRQHQQVLLVLSLHHAIFDGFSMDVLAKNFQQVLAARLAQQSSVCLAPDPYLQFVQQYQDYFSNLDSTQLQSSAELQFWLSLSQIPVRRLFSESEILRANIPVHHRNQSRLLAPALTERLQAVAAARQLPEDCLHTGALVHALVRVFELDAVSLELSNFNRLQSFIHCPTDGIFGYLVSPVPLVINATDSQHSLSAATACQHFLQQAPHHGVGYAGLRQYCQDPLIQQQLATLPTPEFIFNFQAQLNRQQHTGMSPTATEPLLEQLRQTIPSVLTDADMSSAHAIYISTSYEQQQQQVFVGYSGQLFSEPQITRLIDHYLKNLEEMLQ